MPQKSDGAALLLVVVNSKLVVFKTKMIQDTIKFSENKDTESQKKTIATYID